MILKFIILQEEKINHQDLNQAHNYFTAITQHSPNAIIVGYETYKKIQELEIGNMYGYDILIDFKMEEDCCNMCLRR